MIRRGPYIQQRLPFEASRPRPFSRAGLISKLRALAASELPKRVHALAGEHGLVVRRVTVRDQKSRWGSCSHRGHISLNWRLIDMPGSVRDYVIIHELMHLKRMDHSPTFWRLVAAACPHYQEARKFLRRVTFSRRTTS